MKIIRFFKECIAELKKVVCGVNPACVPMVTPSISPIMQPAKQCKVAANAMRLVEVFVLQ